MGRRIEEPDSPRRERYVGEGLLYDEPFQLSNYSQLEFFDWGIRLQGGALFKRFGAIYEFRYEELAEARLAGRMVRRGVIFRTKVPPEPPMFITVDGRAILDRLEQRAVPVDRNATPLIMGPMGLSVRGAPRRKGSW